MLQWCRCAAEPRDADNHRFRQRAEYMRPAFPTLTFPNHWTLLTGLYPSAHGIIANDFYDPAVDKEFVYTEPSKSWDSDWWSGEPVRAAISSKRELAHQTKDACFSACAAAVGDGGQERAPFGGPDVAWTAGAQRRLVADIVVPFREPLELPQEG